jgi:hypothetical protein
MTAFPRITFGIIVLNGEPFTRYCLKALYPFAHEIIVVEGAAPSAAGVATPDGHSIDATLETLYHFKAKDDPEDKLRIIVRDGFWSEKDEQSRAYADRASGDYLWQIDIDEFYRDEDMLAVIDILRRLPDVTAVSFRQITFWGGFRHTVDGWYLKRGPQTIYRLFKWAPGYQYVTHRPPTVKDSLGRNLREIQWITGERLATKGIFLYHYSLLFPKQVIEKCKYYNAAPWAHRQKANQWADQAFMKLSNPFRVHNVYDHPSWIKRFNGKHPSQIESLRADLQSGKIRITLRPTDDIETLIRNFRYRIGRFLLTALQPLDSFVWLRQAKLPLTSRRLTNRTLRILTAGIEWSFSVVRSNENLTRQYQ